MPPSNSPNSPFGIVLVLIAALAWSTAGLFTRLVTTDIPTTLFWRSLIGGLCVLAVYMVIQRNNFRHALRQAFYFSGGEMIIGTLCTAGMTCFIAAFFHTTIANVLFAQGTMPFITFLLALVVLREKADWVSLCSCVLCVVGVAVMLGGAQQFEDLLGIALALGMTFFVASMTIAAKYFPQADAIKSTYFAGFLGALVMLPFSSFVGTLPADYFWLSLYGIANLGLGFGVYLFGVKRVTATTAALVGLLEILLAPIWAYLLFAEQPNVNTLIGGAIIIAATTYYLVVQHQRQQRNP